MSQQIQLACQHGEERRSVDLSVTPTQVRVSTNDHGPSAQRVWGGDGEYEFWVDVTAEAIPTLLFALLREKYQGNLEATDRFRSFCTDNNIPHRFMTWS